MKNLKDMTDEELKSEYLSLYNQIEIADVINTQDLLRYKAIDNELDKRGYDIQEQLSFVKRE